MAIGLDQSLAARVVVRLHGRSGAVVGAGFLVGPDFVATCAHVVAEALAADPYGPPPAGRVRLDLPLFVAPGADEPPTVDAEVIRWRPIAPDGSGDIAVLRIQGPLPPGARMPPVRRVDRLWDHRFRVLGFPDGLIDGVWTTGRIRGEQGTRWFQLQAAAGEQPIVGGFSGSPVWDEESGAVVGMTVAADSSGTTTTAYLVPIDQVLGVDPELLPCPYRGLEPFGEEHAAFFFGRDAGVAELATAVSERPLVAVTGPSGAGKSSLVRAGLLPRLRATGDRVVELRPHPGVPAPYVLLAALPPGAATPDVTARLADPATRPAAVRELAAALAEPRTVLMADQFEELAAADPHGAQELLALVGELVTALPRHPDGHWPVRAVLTLRSATIDDVVRPQVAALLGAGTVLVPPMERSQLREAIVAPAERAPGLSFEPGLVDRILDDAAAEPGGLPLVESLLTELWERRHGGMLTVEAYQRAGGVAGVVATHAEGVVAPFAGTPAEPRLRRLLTSLAGPDRDGRFVRRALAVTQLAPDVAPLIGPLAAGRLVVVERVAGHGDRVQLAHQALIEHWPRLRGWLAEDRAFLYWRDQLNQLRDRWEAANRDEGALLRGSALATAQEWLQLRADDVSAPAREFVGRSRARQRREVRRWRIVTAVLAVLVLVASGLGAVALTSRNQISEQLRLANAELLGQAALARLSDPVTASALALAGWQADPGNVAVRTALVRLAMGTRSVSAVHVDLTADPIAGYGVSEDGMVIATQETDGQVVLFLGLPAGKVERWQVPGVPAGSAPGRVSADGRWLALPGTDGSVHVWDIASRTGPMHITGPGVRPADGGSLSFAHSSDRLSWLTPYDGGPRELVIWDLTRGAVVPHGLGPVTDTGVRSMKLTSDPTTVEEPIVGPDGPLTVRSLTDGSVRFIHPPLTSSAGRGLKMTCVPGEPGVLQVRDASGADLRRIQLLGGQCDAKVVQSRLSQDTLHLVEPRAAGPERDVDVYRITSITDGTTYDLTAPIHPAGAPRNVEDVRSIVTNMAAVPAPDGGRTVLLTRGRSIVTLHAERDAGGRLSYDPSTAILTRNGQFVVAGNDSQATVLDRASGAPRRELVFATLGDTRIDDISVADSLNMLTATADQWVYREFDVPSLVERVHAEPAQPADEPLPEWADVAATDERVSALTVGVLTTWERATGTWTGEPIILGNTQERGEWFRDQQGFDLRPGPVPQVAVVGGLGEVELWNPVTRTLDGVLRTPPARTPVQVAFDHTGTRLITLGVDVAIQVWDVDRREPVGDPVPIGIVPVLQGITGDGHVVLLQASSSPETYQLTFWDLGVGRQSGSVRLSAAHDAVNALDDGEKIRINGQDGAMPFFFPVTADGWVEQLCRFTNRPFTAEEQLLIPMGTDVEEPCPRK